MKAQRYAVRNIERQIKNLTSEIAFAVDNKGRAIRISEGGDSMGTRIISSRVPKNGIITHNHPQLVREYGNGIAARIGNSFTWDDISVGIKHNAKEIRAVTPTYTYSISRPAKGWGITADRIQSAYTQKLNGRSNSAASYYRSNPTQERYARANVVLSHQVIKDLARKYGWKYHKRRSL